MKPVAIVLAAASSLAMVATAPALADRGGVSRQEMVHKFMRIFDRLDRDNNGRIGYKTIRKMENRYAGGHYHDSPRVRVSFGDENFRIAFGTGGDYRHRSRRSYIGPINSRTFHIYDLNGDDRIHRKELRRAVRQEFNFADRNGDGWLSPREMQKSRWYRASHSAGHRHHYPDYFRVGYHSDRRHYHRHDGYRNHDTYRDGYRDGRRAERRADARQDRREEARREARREERRRERRREARREERREERREARREERTEDARSDARRHRREHAEREERRRERRQEP